MPFNEQKAQDAVRFFEKYLRHTKGKYAGSPFLLQPWQKDQIIRPIFGTVNEDGYRQIRQCLVEIPRKNGKSEIAAGIALKLLLADQEPAAEVYGAAGDRDQAALVYEVAEQMVLMSPTLRGRCRITSSKRNIAAPKTASKYRVVSADGRRQHGSNPSGIIFDEVHVQRTRSLYDALTMGQDTRAQPLNFLPTTAGVPDEAPLWWDLHEYARQCREGIFEDPTFLSVHFGALPSDDFDDPTVWRKANPALGTFLSFEKFRANWERARRIPSEWNEFLRYRLNVPTQQADRWLSLSEWDACKEDIEWSQLRGRPCVAGIDLSTRKDITALVMAFDCDGIVRMKPYFWLPKENVPNRLKKWVDAGYIETTEGNAVDYDAVRNRCNELRDQFGLSDVGFDTWNAHQIEQDLTKDGFKVSDLRFNASNMNSPSKEFESRIADKSFRHDGNPVFRWMADCVSIRSDVNGRIVPTKPNRLKSEKRVDGIVAGIMALDRIIRFSGSGLAYDSPASVAI